MRMDPEVAKARKRARDVAMRALRGESRPVTESLNLTRVQERVLHKASRNINLEAYVRKHWPKQVETILRALLKRGLLLQVGVYEFEITDKGKAAKVYMESVRKKWHRAMLGTPPDRRP